jgi:hypothetical protein
MEDRESEGSGIETPLQPVNDTLVLQNWDWYTHIPNQLKLIAKHGVRVPTGGIPTD